MIVLTLSRAPIRNRNRESEKRQKGSACSLESLPGCRTTYTPTSKFSRYENPAARTTEELPEDLEKIYGDKNGL